MSAETEDRAELRLDKWLWSARFFKTRSLAAEAVTGGKVQLNALPFSYGRRAQRSRSLETLAFAWRPPAATICYATRSWRRNYEQRNEL